MKRRARALRRAAGAAALLVGVVGPLAGGCGKDVAMAHAAPPKSAICAACHGVPGRSATAPMYPILAGQHAFYLSAQLRAFRSGARSNPIMQGFASALSDEEIEALAAYYQSLGEAPYHLGQSSGPLRAHSEPADEELAHEAR